MKDDGRNNNIEILVSFVRENVGRFFFYAGCVLIFYAVAALNQLPDTVKRMRYALVLCAFLLVCRTLYDFAHYYKKINQLKQALLHRGESDRLLPAPKSREEELYIQMVEETEEEKRQLISQLDHKRQEMNDYYSMWVHQIKTPIASMKLLTNRLPEPEQSSFSGELFKTEQYAEMALHYIRLDSIASDMLLQEYELLDIVRQAVKKSALLFINSRLSMNLDEFSVRAVTDEKWLSFVVEQLLSNAVKYTREGGIHIYQRSDRCVVIEDTGIGIPKEDLPRVFEKGFTGYNGRMDKKSTGIGLYLCKQVMDRLGHRIWIEQADRQGTRVVLEVGNEPENLTKM